MSIYLNPKLVDSAFIRLASSDNTGKSPLERTSALMYFLAFAATVKNLNCCPLDLNPDTMDGKNKRDAMAMEFVKFVLLKPSSDGRVRQISTLGQVKIGDKTPKNRISSNFYTVPLKKASEATTAHNYPNRPAPLLKMGQVATGLKWGVNYHDDWRDNFQEFFKGIRSNTPFTDLAIFIFRNVPISKGSNTVRDTLSCVMQERFEADLAVFWSCRMDAENVFFKHGDNPYSDTYQDSLMESKFSAVGGASDREALRHLDREALIDKVVYFESLLEAHDIDH